ncbi:3'-5' exonuclease, partial [Streptomyces sp. NPDC059837]|uniref:3'-5' exonuclease n=1 Tax=Streptomyces sp. NPDC059837 TaxID=3346968 RepID=UPI00364F7F26
RFLFYLSLWWYPGALPLAGALSLLARVDVTTVNAYAHRIVTELGGRAPAPIGDWDERQVWQRVRKRLDLPWTEQFLAQEYRHVVLAHGLRGLDDYLAAARPGRGTPLSPARRKLLWPAVEMFTAELRARGAVTHLQVCAEAARLLGGAGARHDHVVVDEAQDLHPAQWRVLRAAVAPGPDDLFITGDPHQRIYDSRVSLASLGISVKGRASRLRINYRSTEEILAWSTGILAPTPVEDLGGEGNDSLAGYRSLLHGRRPHVAGHGSEHAEIAALVERIQGWVAQGIRPAEIGVCARFNVLLDKVHDRLADSGLPVVRVKDNPGPDTNGVRIATMHAMKGLEFRAVAVLGVTASAVPFAREITPAEVDGLQHETDMLRERCLLFVACTRAREALTVSWSGTASAFLPAVG